LQRLLISTKYKALAQKTTISFALGMACATFMISVNVPQVLKVLIVLYDLAHTETAGLLGLQETTKRTLLPCVLIWEYVTRQEEAASVVMVLLEKRARG